jgi:hypothetical protein
MEVGQGPNWGSSAKEKKIEPTYERHIIRTAVLLFNNLFQQLEYKYLKYDLC